MASFYDWVPAEIQALSNTAAIERYATGPDAVRKAVAGLTPAQLMAFPVPGTWSIQQIVVHLLESDLVATHRMRRAVAEDRPVLAVYDETRFAERIDYHAADLNEVGELFRLNRAFMARWLRTLRPEQFERVALHPDNGEMRVGQFLRLYVQHVDHHLKFIEKKRAMIE